MCETRCLLQRAVLIFCLHTVYGRLRQQRVCRGVLYENTNRYNEAEQDYRCLSPLLKCTSIQGCLVMMLLVCHCGRVPYHRRLVISGRLGETCAMPNASYDMQDGAGSHAK